MSKDQDFCDVTVKRISKKEKNQGQHKRSALVSQSGKRIKKVHTIRSRFGLIVLLLFGMAGGITALTFYLLQLFSFYDKVFSDGRVLVGTMALTFVFYGVIITGATLRVWFGRVMRITEGLRLIAKGDFTARVPENDKKEVVTELGDLEKTFNQMASDLQGIEMFRNDFINNFSHEFKTPIVSIRGFARQLEGGNLTEEQKKEYIDIIISESERLANMSQNVLLLTKLENQSIVTEKSEFYLDEQIRSCILLLEKAWSEKNIDLDLDLDEIRYTFNEEMLSHLWINLFSNAIKFTPEGGRIACRLKAVDGDVVFEIEDTGKGMGEEVKARIFEKFYQGDASHATKGNGIGLNIVQRIVTLAGGRHTAPDVVQIREDYLGRQSITGTSVAKEGVPGCALAVRIARLYHETLYDPMKQNPVVETLPGKFQEIVPVQRGEVGQGYADVACRGFQTYHTALLLPGSRDRKGDYQHCKCRDEGEKAFSAHKSIVFEVSEAKVQNYSPPTKRT